MADNDEDVGPQCRHTPPGAAQGTNLVTRFGQAVMTGAQAFHGTVFNAFAVNPANQELREQSRHIECSASRYGSRD